MKKTILTLAAILAFVPSARAENTPLPVIASFSIIGDMVRQIGGDDVSVTTLVGADSDAHSYEPTPRDAKTIHQAKLVIINGLGFEGWLPRLIASSGFKEKTITASQGITPRTMEDEDEHEHEAGHGHTETDPHAWQDLTNGVIYARNIAKALEEALPDRKEAIAQRAAAYEAELKAEDTKIRQEFATIPANKKRIITSHDAFGYFGAAYGVTFLAPVGMNTEAEPSAAGLAKLIKQIKAEGIKTVFLENMTNNRLATQLAKEANAKLGSVLFSDALSTADGVAPTYLAMFKANAATLKAAMQENR